MPRQFVVVDQCMVLPQNAMAQIFVCFEVVCRRLAYFLTRLSVLQSTFMPCRRGDQACRSNPASLKNLGAVYGYHVSARSWIMGANISGLTDPNASFLPSYLDGG